MSIRVIRAGEHVQHIPGWGMTVRESGVAVATSNWWEVPGKTCVAAYQPKGAASYAASKVNLANPGTYDAVNGPSLPTWDATNGWMFAGNAIQYLNTGVSVNGGAFSVIVRFSNYTGVGASERLVGVSLAGNTNPRLLIMPDTNVGLGGRGYSNGNAVGTVAATATSGIMAVAGNAAYYNGTDEGLTLLAWEGANTNALWIGAQNNDGVGSFPIPAYVQAVAIYSDTLTAAQVATVSAAMSLL